MVTTPPMPLAAALAWLAERTARLGAEPVAVAEAAGRVVAAAVDGTLAGPIAGIDGRAVRASDTEAASAYAPLPVAGCAVVAGDALPSAADAVLPLDLVEDGRALEAVAPGHGVVAGEAERIAAATVLRPAHLALLARLGRATVAAVRRPRVALAVAGPKSGADALTPMLAALVAAEGGVVGGDPDLVLHAGRSGPGPDDHGIAAFACVFAHGLPLRPGETAALGMVGGVPAILLPGEPMACATAFALLAAPALRRMGGRAEPKPIAATLGRKIVSGLGQVEAVRVRLEDGRATPLGPAAATLSSAAAAADGLVLVPEGSEGYPGGATVWVHPLP